MIIEPQFPQSFCRFLSCIVARELQTDKARAKLNEAFAKELFLCLDSTSSGCIYLQDIYVFLKKRGVNLTKKELKFVNRYFGFSQCQKLTLQDFQRYFFQSRDPKNVKVEKAANQAQALVDLIELVVEGYGQIEQQRAIASKDGQQLKACLSKFYSDGCDVITSELLKEALYYLQLYSRLNFHLLHLYVIGEEVKQITLKQLFSTTQTSPTETTVLPPPEMKENKKLSIGVSQQSKTPGSFKLKSDSTDILLQIENIETAIKQKKELYSQRKKMLEEDCKKPVGMLVKRPSQTDIKPAPPIKQKLDHNLDLFESSKSKFYPKEEKLQEENAYTASNGFSLEQPKNKYSYIDSIEEQREDYGSHDVEELLRSRMSSKTREQTLSKASSCARLKIQEIQRRVMGRVGQRAAANRVQQYVSKIPSDLRMNSSELRSRYSSLTRN